MQITREAISLETKFEYEGDSCEGCGEKYGYDLFICMGILNVGGSAKLPKVTPPIVLLMEEMVSIADNVDEYKSKEQLSDAMSRFGEIKEKLCAMGAIVTQPEYHLLVYYGKGMDINGESPNRTVEYLGSSKSDSAYIKLAMICELPNKEVQHATLFQGTCRDTDELKKIYDLCVVGANGTVATSQLLDVGEPLPFDHHLN